MVSIADLPESGAFDQDGIEVLVKAFELACMARPGTDRTILAREIIAVAKAGERDPDRLCAAALSALKQRA